LRNVPTYTHVVRPEFSSRNKLKSHPKKRSKGIRRRKNKEKEKKEEEEEEDEEKKTKG
jgi:hypothetical protein